MKAKSIAVLLALLLLTLLAGFRTSTPAAALNPAQDRPAVGNREARVAALAPVVQPKGASGPARYIVQLEETPLAAYAGGANGRQRLDVQSQASRAYLRQLEAAQSAFLVDARDKIGRRPAPVYSYRVALNAVVLMLTPEEAALVATVGGVRLVERDGARELLTDAGPPWIGADAIWNGSASGVATKGEGVVIGILDTGINMDHPSFADKGGDGYDHINPRGAENYTGWCNPAHPQYNVAFVCNDKLIGAWDYADASWNEGDGPEDDNGHGSHVASTAAGNVVSATLYAPTTTISDTISGVAPHANIISYDVCAQSCYDTDVVAAVEQAILDGVDVINESIGLSGTTWNGAKQQAYLNAFAAGVIYVRAAGNDGPDPATIDAEPPWVLSVAAVSHNRRLNNQLTGMSGGDLPAPANMTGAGFTTGYGPAAIVYAGDVPNPNDPGGDPAQCLEPYPVGTFGGQIVVCDRGSIPRIEKGRNVLAGGAGGLVLANTDGEGEEIVADGHLLPAVHIGDGEADLLRAWLASGSGHLATISGTQVDRDPANGDVTADFSSRGPVTDNLLKPDVAAPGVTIWAAVATDDPASPPEYDLYSGTSMASPHAAGAAALIQALHPSWSPAETISALATTSANENVRKDDGTTGADPLDVGAGRLSLGAAANAGLVLDESRDAFLAANPADGGDPTALNIAGLADNDCVVRCQWTRTVKSTWATSVTWTTTATATAGLSLTVAPPTFTLQTGATQLITISAEVGALPEGEWIFGQVNLTPDRAPISAAHLPVGIVPDSGDLPDSVTIRSRRNAGSQLVSGFQTVAAEELTIETLGPNQADLTTFELYEDNDPSAGFPAIFFDDLDGAYWTTLSVPAGRHSAVFEIVETTSLDLDMAVGYDSDGDGQPDASELTCTSADSGSAEVCEIAAPAAGRWWVVIINFESSGAGPDSVTLASAVVSSAASGALSVDGPDSVAAAQPFALRLFWDTPSAEEGDRWYGAIRLGTGPANPGNLGTVPVSLHRTADDVGKRASARLAPAGSTISYAIAIQPEAGEDLAYTITDTLPAGLEYVPGSAEATAGTVSVSGNEIRWEGIVAAAQPRYLVSSNRDDPDCDTPFGGYVDVQSMFGYDTLSTIAGDNFSWQYSALGALTDFYGRPISGRPTFTDDGFVLFTKAEVGPNPSSNQELPDPALPNGLAAIYWRDLEVIYNADLNHGVTGVSFRDGLWLVEFDDIAARNGAGTLDFEIVAWNRATPETDSYDIVYAYDNVNIGDMMGTIGIENEDGTKGTSFAYDVLTPSDGLVICLDWTTEGEPVIITYEARVEEDVAHNTILSNEVIHANSNPGSRLEKTSVTVRVVDTLLYMPTLLRRN